MPAKTASAAALSRREQLKTAYLIAFDNFATTAPEVAAELGITPATATRLLKSMGSLITWDHVNGERTLTFQATETYDSLTREEAIAKFDAEYPEEVAAPAKTSRRGATGPRYTDAQIKKGLAARKAGKTNAEVAAAAGVKSPSYFAKTLKAVEATVAKASAPVREKATTKAEVAAASKRKVRSTGRRGRGNNGGGSKRIAR